MRRIKCLQFTFLVLLLYSCSNVKSLYEKGDVDKNDKRSITLIEKFELKNEKSILYFTEDFNNNHVKISFDQTVIYDRKLETIEQLGFAGSCTIENSNNIVINIDNKNIIITAEKLKLYKFIYLKKTGKKYVIVYTNKAHSFK